MGEIVETSEKLNEPGSSNFELPPGTIIKINGVPYELKEPAKVSGHKCSLSQSDALASKPFQAAVPVNLATNNSSLESM